MIDVDSTEIQIRVRQPDGSYDLRWVPRSDLVKLIQNTTLDALEGKLFPLSHEGRQLQSKATETPPA